MLTQQSLVLSVPDGKRITTALFAAVFGAVLLYFVGFANAELLHNAAHDTRHAITAPCH